MLTKLAEAYPYIIVFSTFNFIISVFYYIYGWINYRKKAHNIQHSELSIEEITFLKKIQFQNVKRNWIKSYGLKLRNFSIIYFIVSEMLCSFAVLLSDKYILICRISLFTAIALLLLWIVLLINFKPKVKILEKQHKKNLKKALEDFNKNCGEEE